MLRSVTVVSENVTSANSGEPVHRKVFSNKGEQPFYVLCRLINFNHNKNKDLLNYKLKKYMEE
ncbi:unnamed protein product [Debaryomyces tyrocola]|nr:unnamed protein product [Debaryomyces tyrocola]